MTKWVIIFILLISCVFINGSPFIFGDGYGYYHTAKTLSTQGKLVTSEEPSYFEYTGHAVNKDSRENYSTNYPLGNSIFWLPGLTISKLINSDDTYYPMFNGHSLNDGVSILVTGTIALFISLILTYKILRKLGFSNRNSVLSVISIYISMYIFSNLFYFSSYAHINELFSFTLLIYLFQNILENPLRRNWIVFGFVVFLLTVTRPVDIVVALPFAIYIIYKQKLKSSLYIFLGGIPLAVLFLIYNLVSFGSPFKLGQISELFSLSNFNLVNLLFSDIRGLFIWSPILLIATISLIYFSFKSHNVIYKLGSTAFLILLLIYNFWPNWWGGDSLGQRFFIVLAPIFAIALAKFLSSVKLKRGVLLIAMTLVISLTTFSFLVQLLYRVTPVRTIHSVDRDVSGTVVLKEERFTPFDIINYHVSALSQLGVSTDYAGLLLRSFNGGRSLLLLAMGQTDPLVKAEAFGSEMHIFLAPNTAGIFPADVLLIFQYKDKNYQIENITPGITEIRIDCSDSCSSDQVEVQITDRSIETIRISDDFRLGVISYSRVNLINRKLK